MQPHVLKGYETVVNNFENQFVPKALDLFQCAQFFDHLLEGDACSDKDSNKGEILAARDEISRYLSLAKNFTEDLQTTCWSTSIPDIPEAEVVLSKYPLLTSPKHNTRSPNGIFLTQKKDSIHGKSFKSIPETYQSVQFSTVISLCVTMDHIFQTYYQFTSNDVPKYVLYPTNKMGDVPTFDQRSFFGRGDFFYSPSGFHRHKEMLCSRLNLSDGKFPVHKYIGLYEVTNCEDLEVDTPVINFSSSIKANHRLHANARPRAISKIGEYTFFFHKKVPLDIELVIKQAIDIVNNFTVIMTKAVKDTLTRIGVISCTGTLRKLEKRLHKLKEAQSLATLTVREIKSRAEQLVYGLKCWSDRGERCSKFRSSLLNENRIFIERNLSAEDAEINDHMMFIEESIELQDAVDEARSKAHVLAFKAFRAMYFLHRNLEQVDDTLPALIKLKTILFFLNEQYNDISAEPQVRLVKYFKIDFNVNTLLPAAVGGVL